MGRDWLLNALAMCERHVTQSTFHLADQEKRIAAGVAAGREMSVSLSIMSTLQETHRLHVEHRDTIARELKAL